MLDLELLKTFVCVVDEGSFTRAAERVHRTQSTVSQQVRKLEDLVGHALLLRDRTGLNVSVTEHGELLIHYARRLLALSAEASEALASDLDLEILRIGMPEDFDARRMALILAGFGWHRLDAIFGIDIAFYILWSALTIARESVAVLMDAELSVEITERMHMLACAVPGALGAHDLRTRISGTRWFVQLHLELPNEMPLSQVHELCEQVETAIQAEFPQAEVLVHPDPQDVLPASA